jgi:hypothetical protein
MQKIYKIIKMHSCFDSIKLQNLRIGYAKGKSLKKRMHPLIKILIQNYSKFNTSCTLGLKITKSFVLIPIHQRLSNGTNNAPRFP